MDIQQIEMIEASFHAVSMKEEFVMQFYDNLFKSYPSIRAYFVNTDMTAQREKLLFSLLLIIDHLRTPTALDSHLREIGDLHINQLKIPRRDFDALLDVLILTLQSTLGEAWSDKFDAAWRAGYNIITELMETHAFSVIGKE